MKRTDLMLGLYILVPIIFLIIPIPLFLLDILMMLNLAIALFILFNALFSTEALNMSSFPTLLLMTTLFRISLNVGSTRNILLKGEAGNVVRRVCRWWKSDCWRYCVFDLDHCTVYRDQ